MMAVFSAAAPGMTKHELVEALRREEVSRGLTFEYCLITSGTSLNRAPSDRRIEAGDILSLDSGANYRGYIGDLCRMGLLGEPDAELEDLLAAVDKIQQAARKSVRAGVRGGDGMGLISHEAPRLTGTGAVTYPGDHTDRPLESGMVLSIETTMLHPRRGFIKIEDT